MELESSAEECGCAPTPRELRALSRRSALGIGVAGGLLLFGGASAFSLAPAFAESYPSWDDVQNAKANEAAKSREVTRIEGLIQSLTAEVERTQAEAQRLSDEFYVAQQAYFDAAKRADDLQAQADEQAAAADEAAQKAGRVAAQLYRDGGDDTAMQLFFSGSAVGADELLARLGTMDKLLERNQTVYEDAVTARDAAQSYSDQAVQARNERDKLQQEAEQKMIAAQEAAAAAQVALDNQTTHLGNLQAQLAALKDETAKTVAGYQAGVEAERKAREERARKAREEAERIAREQAANGGGNGGAVTGGGWARPSSGYVSSGYGRRSSVCNANYCSSSFHYGYDFAPGCGAAFYAACAGRVGYVGRNGGYGNYIKIDHGGGIGTGYAHIVDGGFWVGYGQWVGAGQAIAATGNTGNSFGCNLHFETYVNGAAVNPSGFMAARGVYF